MKGIKEIKKGMNKQAVWSSEILVNLYQTTLCYIPEGSITVRTSNLPIIPHSLTTHPLSYPMILGQFSHN
jgi:hypothetical protein